MDREWAARRAYWSGKIGAGALPFLDRLYDHQAQVARLQVERELSEKIGWHAAMPRPREADVRA